MSLQRHIVRLAGCTTTPLACYLKALGIFRLVAEQKDPEATAWWEGDQFVLESVLSEEGLLAFFANDYRPAPIMAPWNKGSGFYPKDSKNAKEAIASSRAERFSVYREALKVSEDVVCMGFSRDTLDEYNALGEKIQRLSRKKDAIATSKKKEFQERQDELLEMNGLGKPERLQAIRNSCPEEMLAWFDAAVVLGGDTPNYPPLLGTGGNDGRLDFTNNFMQRLCSLIDVDTGMCKSGSMPLLRTCMYAVPVSDLPRKMAIGQFSPSAAGGANMDSSFTGEPLNNPWDFVFMLEGCLLFASALSRRMGIAARGSLSYPFAFRTASVGYGSAALSDESNSRDEQWVPIWDNAARYPEVVALFSEGRAQVGRRAAGRSVDFARALATLGTDRGIQAFQRFSFKERNGLAYLAINLGKWEVVEKPKLHLLSECEDWIDYFRQAATKPNAPSSLGRALRGLEGAIMESARGDGALTRVLTALGAAEREIIRSPRTARDFNLRPLPRLSQQWLEATDDGSPEFRLACSLASIRGKGEGKYSIGPLRSNMVPYDFHRPTAAFDHVWMDKPHIVWQGGALIPNLISVLRRRCMESQRSAMSVLPLEGRYPARLTDVLAFINGHVDERRLEELLWGLNAIDWDNYRPEYAPGPVSDEIPIPPAYALLKLTHDTTSPAQPYDPGTLAAAASGRCAEATRRATRRLRASGRTPLLKATSGNADHIRRCAAATLFPLRAFDVRALSYQVLRNTRSEES